MLLKVSHLPKCFPLTQAAQGESSGKPALAPPPLLNNGNILSGCFRALGEAAVWPGAKQLPRPRKTKVMRGRSTGDDKILGRLTPKQLMRRAEGSSGRPEAALQRSPRLNGLLPWFR